MIPLPSARVMAGLAVAVLLAYLAVCLLIGGSPMVAR